MLKELLPKKLKTHIALLIETHKAKGRQKFFCVGRNKTGTTSLKRAFEDLGFIVGRQYVAEELHDKYFFDGKYEPIIEYCKTAQVFQDVPFSHSEIIQELDQAYPDSKFILTIRDNAEQWYNSITKYHAKKHGLDGRIPTYDDIVNCEYLSRGFLKRLTIDAHGTTPDDPYNKETLITHYEQQNKWIRDYFKNRPNDLLIINLSEPDAYQKFIKFIGVESEAQSFPWENRT